MLGDYVISTGLAVSAGLSNPTFEVFRVCYSFSLDYKGNFHPTRLVGSLASSCRNMNFRTHILSGYLLMSLTLTHSSDMPTPAQYLEFQNPAPLPGRSFYRVRSILPLADTADPRLQEVDV